MISDTDVLGFSPLDPAKRPYMDKPAYKLSISTRITAALW